MQWRVRLWAMAITVAACAGGLTGGSWLFCQRAVAFESYGNIVCGINGDIPTLSARIRNAEVSVIARLVDDVAAKSGEAHQGSVCPEPDQKAQRRYEIVEVLKGAELLGETEIVEAFWFGSPRPGTLFLINARAYADGKWGAPRALTERTLAYLRQLPGLPEKGVERFRFFYGHLFGPDESIRYDAQEEFIAAPYHEMKAARECYEHDRLVAAIHDDEADSSRRSLFLKLLGIVSRGNPRAEDLRYLEQEINSNQEFNPSLEAVIGCYLTLRGAAALPMIEDKFLKDRDSSYASTSMAIMALRFHARDENAIPRRRVLSALRLLLDRPDFVHQVIPDLVRWEDWSAVNRLATLFKNADDTTNHVRTPVIQYLRACPLPEAKQRLKELAQFDRAAVRSAYLATPLKKPTIDDFGP